MRRLLLLLFLAACSAAPSSSRGVVWLPIIQAPRCLFSDEAQTIADLLVKDYRQQRPVLRCHPKLVVAAQKRAQNLADLGYFAHCDPSGKCANAYAEEAGCHLPKEYMGNGNNIESLIAGPNNAAAAYWLLSASPKHAAHLFGVGDFFRAQTDYGIGTVRAPGSRFEYYYVFLLGQCITP